MRMNDSRKLMIFMLMASFLALAIYCSQKVAVVSKFIHNMSTVFITSESLVSTPPLLETTTGTVNITYKPPESLGISDMGLPFVLQYIYTKEPEYFIDIDTYDLDNVTFVTGVSNNHFYECMDAIAGIQHHYPARKIIFYDLGLDAAQVDRVKSWCGVEFRMLNFSRYPSHITNLKLYAFKPIIVQEVLMEYEAVFWIDASVKFPVDPVDTTEVHNIIRSTGGLVILTHNGGIFKYTHPGMYAYIPSNTTWVKRAWMGQSGLFIMYRTEKIYHNIQMWWYYCALVEDCIAPQGHYITCKDALRETECHRYDQSAINLLALNYFGYHKIKYMPATTIALAARKSTNIYEMQLCNGHI